MWVKGKRWKEDEVVGEIGIRQREVRREFAEGEQGTEELVRILAGVSRESRRTERRGREIIIVRDGIHSVADYNSTLMGVRRRRRRCRCRCSPFSQWDNLRTL